MLYIYQFPDWTHFRFDSKKVLDALGKARFAEGKLAGIYDICGSRDFENRLIAEDIAANFAIDSHALDTEAVLAEVLLKAQGNEVHIRNYLGAVANAANPLTLERLESWHQGYARTRGMRDTGSTITAGSIQFTGPGPERLHGEMENFLNWFENTPMDGMIKAAIAHFWFLTLRPFHEGNGRLARAITALQLCRGRKSTHLIYALNTQILKNHDEYLSIINKAQCGNGDITEWILWFLDQIREAVQTSESMLEAGLRRFRFQARHSGTPTGEREQALLEAAIAGTIPREFTAKDVAALFGTSHDTALREIQSLIEKGLVTASKKGGRSRTYSVVE